VARETRLHLAERDGYCHSRVFSAAILLVEPQNCKEFDKSWNSPVGLGIMCSTERSRRPHVAASDELTRSEIERSNS